MKRPHIMLNTISSFFIKIDLSQKDIHTKGLLEGVMLFVINGFLLVKIMEPIWLHQLVYILCPRVVFPSWSWSSFSINGKKTLVECIQHALVTCISTTYTFDLWMSKRTHDVFAIIVNCILRNWELKHITSIVP
jgi:hypothetical protein